MQRRGLSILLIVLAVAARDAHAGWTPMGDNPQVIKAVDQLNQSPGVSAIAIPIGNTLWIKGTVNGQSCDWVRLYTFSDAERDEKNADGLYQFDGPAGPEGIAIWEGLLLNDPNIGARLAKTLLHELLHAILEFNHPIFASTPSCKKCVHQFIFATTASELCNAGSKCPTNSSWTQFDRKKFEDQANRENRRCERAENADHCADCDAPDKPVIPPCPGPCSVGTCPA